MKPQILPGINLKIFTFSVEYLNPCDFVFNPEGKKKFSIYVNKTVLLDKMNENEKSVS